MSRGREVVAAANKLLELSAVLSEVQMEIKVFDGVGEGVASELATNLPLPSVPEPRGGKDVFDLRFAQYEARRLHGPESLLVVMVG